MADKRNIKTKIWVYAVVLFTSAFIVLLITAYSQIKLNRNIVDFKTQISNQQSEKNKYQLSYANAQEMNSKLSDENAILTEDNKNLQETIGMLEKDASEVSDKTTKQIAEYAKFSDAQSEYLIGNKINGAQLLKKINVSLFDDKTKELYDVYSAKIFDEVGKELYNSGYKLYTAGKYYEATEKLALSRDISFKSDYSDNCLYYLAHSVYKTGLKSSAVDYMKTLIKEYPSSSFIKYAESFVKKYDE